MESKLKLDIVISNSFNPYFNLALEEKLFNEIEENRVILYLWQNKNAVIIGRNQNAYKECDYTLLKNEGGTLARRLSGGGAVYHDLGNLNFTFICKNNLFDISKNLKVIIEALKKFEIDAYFSGRNDLLVNNLKFSGNAYYDDGDKCYHHGTILISSDLEKLSKYLTISSDKLKWKGIDSVLSRVTNLVYINPNINVIGMKESLIHNFKNIFQGDICRLSTVDEKNLFLEKEISKYSSFDFIFGQSPTFQINISKKYNFGEIDVHLSLKDGLIDTIEIYSDTLDTKLVEFLKFNLTRSKYSPDLLDNLIRNYGLS